MYTLSVTWYVVGMLGVSLQLKQCSKRGKKVKELAGYIPRWFTRPQTVTHLVLTGSDVAQLR